MGRWISKNISKSWITPLVFSIFIHAIFIFIFTEKITKQQSEQKTPKQKPMKLIKSYLVVSKVKPKTEIVDVEVDKLTTKVKRALPAEQNKVIKQPVLKEKVVSEQLVKEKTKTEASQTKVKELTSIPDSATKVKKNIPSISAARNYLNQQQSAPPTSWQQHQLANEKSNFQSYQQNIKSRKYDGKFTTGIRGMTDLGESADGSQLVKSGDGCYSIKKDQFGDSLWLNTPCPLSADPLRQAYRNSMDKYLKKKQN